MDCLIYALENNCPCSENTLQQAAYWGRITCLKYLHKKGYPWCHDTAIILIRYNYLDCLKYAIDNGCTLPDDWVTRIKPHKLHYSGACLRYILLSTWPQHYLFDLVLIINKIITKFNMLIDIMKLERYYIPNDIWTIIKDYW